MFNVLTNLFTDDVAKNASTASQQKKTIYIPFTHSKVI